MVLLPLSLGALVWLAATSSDVVRPADVPSIAGAADRAAQAAQGQRLLVLNVKPGTTPTGDIYESSRGANGWAAYAPTFDPADPLLPALKSLGNACAEEYGRDGKLSAPSVRALGVLGVAVVVAGDGSSILTPDVGERDPLLGFAPEVPALRVRHAQPVALFLAEQTGNPADDAITFARTLRSGDANFQDYEDRAAWGGDVTINAETDGEFLLTWSAAGARVTLDDKPAQFRAARVPMIVLKVPAGRHRVSVRYGDEQMGRQGLVLAAMAVALVSFIALWLGLRPTPAAEGAPAS
jgi:hypothetical protein